MVMALATAAQERANDLEPQSLATIALSLARLDSGLEGENSDEGELRRVQSCRRRGTPGCKEGVRRV